MTSFSARHRGFGIQREVAHVGWIDMLGAIAGRWRLTAPKTLAATLDTLPSR